MANTTVQSEQIQDGSITAAKLADGTIVAAELADNAVVTAAINADAVTGAKIADNAINSEHYTDGSIDTAHIADAQITVGKMAANSVDSDQYVDGSIDTVHIADLQVTTAKIANGNISTAKIADNAVTSAKIDTNIDIAGTLDVTGATTLDSTLAVAGVVTANAGVVVDNITIDGTEIDLSSGDLTLDVEGDIILDANGTQIILKDNGTEFAQFLTSSTPDHLYIRSMIQDKDIILSGNDNGSFISALTLDMSNAGTATFNNYVIAGATNDARVYFYASSGYSPRLQSSTNDLSIYTNNEARVTILNDGKVGIGVSPTHHFNLEGTGTVEARFRSSNGDMSLQISSDADETHNSELNFMSGTSGRGAIVYDHNTTAASQSMNFKTGDLGVTAMTILGDGKVGIGTTSPTNTLDLGVATQGRGLTFGNFSNLFSEYSNASFWLASNFYGNAGASGYKTGATGTFGAAGIRVHGTGGGNHGIIQFFVDAQSNKTAGNAFTPTERMRIDSNGNLLVGTTSAGTQAAGGIAIVPTSDSLIRVGHANGTSNGALFMQFSYNAGAIGSISQNGTSQVLYNVSSDARLKDVTGEARGLEVINALNPVSFNWKSDGQADEGLIAQEVEKIVPNAVSQNEQDYYQMDYSKLVTNLIAGIQEQQTIIEAQTSSINDLKTRIEALES